MNNHDREISLTIRGFSHDAHSIVKEMPIKPDIYGNMGEVVPWNRRKTHNKNIIIFSNKFGPRQSWSTIIEDFITTIGGDGYLCKLVTYLSPEKVHIDITLPISESKIVEDNFISNSTLKKIVMIGASLGFSFPG